MIALILTIIPFPEWARPYRPEWILLVLLYWTIALPNNVGVGVAWGVGLLVDVLRGTLLGHHALGFALTAYIALRFHQRIRTYPLHQQAFFIALFMIPYMTVALWIEGLRGQDPDTIAYWAPVLTSALFWPWVFLILRSTRRSADLQ